MKCGMDIRGSQWMISSVFSDHLTKWPLVNYLVHSKHKKQWFSCEICCEYTKKIKYLGFGDPMNHACGVTIYFYTKSLR